MNSIGRILTIAGREITRVRSRFTGGSRLVVMLVLIGASAVSYLAFRHGGVLSRGIYRVGVSPDGPLIEDARFSVISGSRSSGYSMLDEKTIDVYVYGDEVAHRNDPRSLYAVGALKQYLEKQELIRIMNQVELDRAFPLRIEVNYLPVSSENSTVPPGASLTEMLDGLTGSAEEPTSDAPPSTLAGVQSGTDPAVREQIKKLESGDTLPKIEMEFASDKEIIVPSLMDPPIPFAQVVIAFLYVLPTSFVSVFFTSSFMDEKTDRRISILLSTPVRPFEIVIGKMLPYVCFSLLSVVIITIAMSGDVLLALAIFVPVILFIFAIYLMVPLVYRTFRDTTFISMLAMTLIISYLVFPAMFAGVNDLSYMSPLTLAVSMYRGEPFGLKEYLFSTVPMYFIFLLSLYVGTRILTEEYLMGFRPLYRKVAEAIYLAIAPSHIHLSIALLGLLVVPVVFMVQLVTLAVSLNLPLQYAVWGLLMMAVVIEEVAKSAGIAVLIEKRAVRTTKDVLSLSLLSAVSFLVGEKLLLLVSLNTVSQSAVSGALFGSGLLLIPLAVHVLSTLAVCVLTHRFGVRRYAMAVLVGSVLHGLYNLSVLGGVR